MVIARIIVPIVAKNIRQKAITSGVVGVNLMKIEAKDVAVKPKASAIKKWYFANLNTGAI